MEIFTMVVLIVAISCATSVATQYLKTKKHVHKRGEPDLLERIENLEIQMGDGSLEERVRALETIVTDEKRRLDKEISSL